MSPSPVGRLEVRGLRVAGRDVGATVSGSGDVVAVEGLDGLDVRVG